MNIRFTSFMEIMNKTILSFNQIFKCSIHITKIKITQK